jgi:hypothetical protein
MAAIPELRLAICKRCRWPARRAAGAATDDALLAEARTCAPGCSEPLHTRLSQCLNCCDGGHTVRLEFQGWEFALVGIRTEAEIAEVVNWAPQLVRMPPALAALAEQPVGDGLDVPPWLLRRVYQVWRDGQMLWHRNT